MELISGLRTKNLKRLTSSALFIVVSIISTYCILVTLTNTFAINTDSLALFEQYKLINSVLGKNLLDIHLARIPSLFPDLALTAMIHQIFPYNGNLDNLSNYVWAKLFILILAASSLLMIINRGEKNASLEAAKIGIITFALANSSFSVRQALGLAIVPAHHGGNAINTILLFIIVTKLIEQPKNITYATSCFLLTIFAVSSNKLVLFTGIGPTLIVLLLIFKTSKKSAALIFGLITASGIGILFESFLNTQCSPRLSVEPLSFIQAIPTYLQFGWIPIVTTLLALVSLLLVIGDIIAGTGSNLNKKAGVALISLSALSFYIYIPLITGSFGSHIRYLVTVYWLAPIFFCLYLDAIFNRFKIHSLLIPILAAAFSFISPLRSSIRIYAFWPKQLILAHIQEKEFQKPFYAATIFIKKNGYDAYAGFGDFWSSGITMISNGEVEITPIKPSGQGDFWATSPQTVKNYLSKASQSKVYIFSINKQFSEQLIKNFGTPEKDWHYNAKINMYQDSGLNYNTSQEYRVRLSDARILLFKGNSISKKVLNSAFNFQRQCNRDQPNFKER